MQNRTQSLESNTAAITFNINSENDLPTAVSAGINADEMEIFTFDIAEYIDDIETDDSLLFVDFILSGGALGGTVSYSGTEVTYDGTANSENVDYIPYRVSDGANATGVVLFSIEAFSACHISK